jgi:hypothetical protein
MTTSLRNDECALLCGIAFIILIEFGIWLGGVLHWYETGIYIMPNDPRLPPDKGASWY